MNPENDWLNEMMDAALTDSPESVTAPDFEAIRQASSRARKFSAPGRRILIAAAAAVLAVSIAIPAGIVAGRRIVTRRLIHEQNTLFVEELISGTIFDEGFDASEAWLFDETIDENFFDI
jgi:hypothetical protein